jgi:colanic acid/amylovoran biosynthesis glycosyltransferase
MPPFRLAYVVNMFPKLSETFVLEEVAELTRRGVDVRILSLKTPGDLVQHPLVDAAQLGVRTWYDRTAFEAALAQNRPDLVHAHFATEPTRVAREVAQRVGVPFSFTAHGYDVYRKPPADLADRARAAAAVVTVSQANADHLVERFGVPRSHITVLPCGVDLGRFQPASTPADHRTVVAVARLRPVKNLGLLLRVGAELRARHVEHRVVVVGDGPSRAELEAERDRLGLTTTVRFVGALDQDGVLGWWQRATVGVLTSTSEGMPVSLMEAAACGVPVVAPAVGGVPELVEHGRTGFVVPSQDLKAFADALELLLTDAGLRQRFSGAAATRARERFGVARQVDALLDLWTSRCLQVAS